MTWRAWLEGGRYVLVEAETEDDARRKLTRTQRRKLRRLVPIRGKVGDPE